MRHILIVVMLVAFMSCSETEYERNFHTHWHKHEKSDWAYHADGHSHPIEELDVRVHVLRFGKEGKIIVPGHVWYYHGYIDEKDKYEQYLQWATENLPD